MNLASLSESISETVRTGSQFIVGVHGRRGYPLSGTIWDQNHIITTSRAIDRSEDLSISLPNSESVTASLIGQAPKVDLALLKTDSPLNTPTWLRKNQINVGELALRLGYAGGNTRATLGIISHISDGQKRRGRNAIYTDADRFRGYSGGPLINAVADIVGLNSSSYSRDDSAVIPTEVIESVVTELQTHGRLRQGYLGVSGQPIRLPSDLRESLEQRAGLLIMSVTSDSPAAKAGLAMGDTLLSLNGVKLARPGQLNASLSGDSIGQEIPVLILRGGKPQTLNLTIEERLNS